MEVGKSVVTEALGGNKKVFVIPLYQRNYSWGKKECLKLFTDVISIVKYDNIKDYFLGTIVYALHKTDLNYNELTLIDGQQRLTSISLLLKAISKKIQDSGEDDTNEIDSTYLKNKKAAIEEYGYILKLKPNNKDDKTYSEIMEDKEVTDKTSNLYLNYLNFLEWLDTKNEGLTYQQVFSCLENVKIVYIKLENDDDPQLVFETINSTGKGLMFSDLIRNCILTSEKADVQNNLYINYWKPLEDILGDDIEKFIRPYLQIQVGKVFTKSETYNQFRNFYIPRKTDAESVLGDMVSYAKVFNKIEKGLLDEKRFGTSPLIFKELDYTLTYPFVMELLFQNEKGNVSDDEVKNILETLSSYIFRKTVLRVNLTMQFASIMVSMYKKISKSKHKDKSFIINLLEIDTQKMSFPTDNEFIEALSTRDVYNSRFASYLLRTLENNRSKEKTDFSNVSIEHIMPQNPDENWAKRIPNKELYNSNLHRLGNLSLTAYNSEKKNKVKDIYTTSKITLNKGININTWDIKCIDERSTALATECASIWKYPDTSDLKFSGKAEIVYIDVDSLDISEISENGLNPNHLSIGKTEWAVLSWEEVYSIVESYVSDNYSSKVKAMSINNEIQSIQEMRDFLYEIDENLSVKVSLG